MKSFLSFVVLISLAYASLAQQIERVEYFWDTDPGFGNAVSINFTPDTVVSNLNFNADATMLSAGLHLLYVRSQDDAFRWSLTQAQYVYKFPTPLNTVLPQITQLEYFIDSDPGFGQATAIPFTPDSVVQVFTFSANVSALNPGLHALYIRSKDATGKWSLTNMQYMYKFPAPANANLPSITQLEYFIDMDPGFGQATAIPFTPDSSLQAFTFSANVSALNPGLHILYLRAKDATGKWSLTNMQYMYKFPAPANANLPSLTQLEYFIDTDPGFGQATAIPFTPDSNLQAFTFSANVSALNTGLHILYLRAKDATEKWSLTNMQYMYKFPAPPNTPLPAVTQLEYFIDTDPGFGLATAIPFTSDSLVQALKFSADVSSLNPGLHILYLRSKDATGKWSLTNMQYMYKFPIASNTLPNITKVEYFLDTDPGFDMAIPVPISSDTTVNNVSFPINVSNLSEGTHHVFVRSKDASGKWSLTRSTQFVRSKIKFFIQGLYSGNNTMVPLLYNLGISSNPTTCDTVLVELRQNNFPYTVKATAKGLLYSNGEVTCNLITPAGNYYLVVKHRNTVETWSSAPVTVGGTGISYNFSVASNKAYGNNQKQVETGVWALYSGDVNQDDDIDAMDYLIMDPNIIVSAEGYVATDINGDGVVDALDYIMLDINIVQGVGSVYP